MHHREDETFLILEGEATVTVGDLEVEAWAGDLEIGPRGLPHRDVADPAGCRPRRPRSPTGS